MAKNMSIIDEQISSLCIKRVNEIEELCRIEHELERLEAEADAYEYCCRNSNYGINW